jgi:hypothetical protein
MSDPLPTYALKDILPLLQRGEVIAAVREALIDSEPWQTL